MARVQDLQRAVGRAAVAVSFGGALIFAGSPAGSAEWQPQKPVEMVIMAGQGGGADRLARLFQALIQENDLAGMPFVPLNKGGGSGAEALVYLNDKAGDPHVVMATLNSYYTTPLRTDIGVDVAEFTPLARMALDTFVLWVNAESDVTNLEEFVAAVQAADGTWKMGGTGSGQEDELITGMLEREFDISFTYVPFSGGGEVAKQLVGGHIDSTVNNPSEALGFLEAGLVRPIAAFTPERLEALPETPTMAEQGHDLTYFMQRSFVAPPDIPEEARAYYIDLLTALAETEAWQQYAAEKSLMTDFITGDELQAFLLESREQHEALLRDLGEIK